jgi:hypothetical protein
MYVAVEIMLYHETSIGPWMGTIQNEPAGIYQHKSFVKWNIFLEYDLPYNRICLALRTPVSTVALNVEFERSQFLLCYCISFKYWGEDSFTDLRKATFTRRFLEQELRSAVRMFLEVCRTQTSLPNPARNVDYLLAKRFCLTCAVRCWRIIDCLGCKTAIYCSTACQETDWAVHKNYCADLSRVALV